MVTAQFLFSVAWMAAVCAAGPIAETFIGTATSCCDPIPTTTVTEILPCPKLACLVPTVTCSTPQTTPPMITFPASTEDCTATVPVAEPCPTCPSCTYPITPLADARKRDCTSLASTTIDEPHACPNICVLPTVTCPPITTSTVGISTANCTVTTTLSKSCKLCGCLEV